MCSHAAATGARSPGGSCLKDQKGRGSRRNAIGHDFDDPAVRHFIVGAGSGHSGQLVLQAHQPNDAIVYRRELILGDPADLL
uniref:hypothetical protein n=1 Tax=Serratia marcescens TaxID=615 RepID=UPI0019544975